MVDQYTWSKPVRSQLTHEMAFKVNLLDVSGE